LIVCSRYHTWLLSVDMNPTYYCLRQRCNCRPLFMYLFIYLFASRVAQKVAGGFRWNFPRKLGLAQLRGCKIFRTWFSNSSPLIDGGPISTRMGDCLWTGKPSCYITNQPGQLSLPSLQGKSVHPPSAPVSNLPPSSRTFSSLPSSLPFPPLHFLSPFFSLAFSSSLLSLADSKQSSQGKCGSAQRSKPRPQTHFYAFWALKTLLI